ncbi:MAG: hypothetical protein GTO14_09395 [Anaerolineales bacterium]|nr:hypothetical protein [Anaerolineales bacterium]
MRVRVGVFWGTGVRVRVFVGCVFDVVVDEGTLVLVAVFVEVLYGMGVLEGVFVVVLTEYGVAVGVVVNVVVFETDGVTEMVFVSVPVTVAWVGSFVLVCVEGWKAVGEGLDCPSASSNSGNSAGVFVGEAGWGVVDSGLESSVM